MPEDAGGHPGVGILEPVETYAFQSRFLHSRVGDYVSLEMRFRQRWAVRTLTSKVSTGELGKAATRQGISTGYILIRRS